MEQDVAKPATTIDPMGFLGEAQPAPDAAEQLEESQGEIEPGDPESPDASDAQKTLADVNRNLREVAEAGGYADLDDTIVVGGIIGGAPENLTLDDSNSTAEQRQLIRSGDYSRLSVSFSFVDGRLHEERSRAEPSAADLDAVAEEKSIADATGDSATSNDVPKMELRLPTSEQAEQIRQGLDSGDLVLEAGGRRFPNGDVVVDEISVVAAPTKPAPRRVGCEHGFPNAALCPTCRANKGR